MDPLDIVQAISAGICFYAGIVHLMIGLRSEPRNRVHLSFAVVSILYGFLSLAIFALVAAVDTGSLTYYVFVDKVSFLANYLAIAGLIWFIAAYTGAEHRLIPLILTGLYILIGVSSFVMPFPITWIYTDIVLNPTFPPDIVVAPWYSVEQIFTWLTLTIFTGYYSTKQYQRGEKEAARALAIAMGIFLFTLLWDYAIEYGLIDTVLMAQYGFLAFIIIMSLRLSGQAVEAEKEARRLNIALEDRVAERTAELSTAKESAESAVTELQESESRLDYVLRSAQLAVWEYDLQELETKVTDAFPYLLGYEPDQILVKSDEKWRGYELGHQSLAVQLLYEADKERYAANLGEMIAGKETFEVEYRLRMVDGQFHWMRDHGKIVKWDEEGKPLLAYGVVMDIDNMKRLQLELIDARDAAETANRAKSVFLANMSHELRTPLNAILGFTQLMRRDPTFPPNQKENLAIIDQSGEYLLDLINDVLEMSRIEAGHITLEASDFDLYRTLDSLESIMRMRAERKGLDLIFEHSAEVPQFISTDERKLRQVLINLVGNGIKFTEQGFVKCQVTSAQGTHAEIESENGANSKELRQLSFVVSDSGVGIAPEELGQLYEPFSQTTSGQRAGRGTGLGLPISQQFVSLMGSSIIVESEVGQGSTFTFEVPVELAGPQDILVAEPAQRVAGLAPGEPTYRILVVDDSVENRALLSQMVAGIGVEVQTADDGQAAIEIHQEWQPHLIWMDIRMPGMDGYEATRRIKADGDPKTVVIAVTASVFEEERELVLAAGCDDFVRKPFSEAEIFDKMAEHLGIAYTYEARELDAAEGESDEGAVDMTALPDQWRTEIGHAARRGRSQILRDLIAQIESDYPEEAKTLRGMVDELAFTEIVAFVETDKSDEQPPA
jgi:signal transduction histidine kinase/CheY-like chemotaxis protein